MAVRSQVFAGTHAQALHESASLDAGAALPTAPHVELPGLTAYEIELLGEVAAQAVRFGTGDLEMAEVDLEHEQLFRVPPFLVEVLVELGASEDPDAVADVARQWRASEEMDATDEDLEPTLESLVELATNAQEAGHDLYLWVGSD